MTKARKRRSRGTGGIVKLASGYYAYQYVTNEGKRKTKSLRTKNRKEAEERSEDLDKVQVATDKEEVMLHLAHQKNIIHSRELPLDEVWQEFEATKPSAGPGTLGLYNRVLQHFIAWLRDSRPDITSFSSIDQKTAHRYMEHIWQSGISVSTYNDKRNALGHITKKLAIGYNIESNPWPNTERKKQSRGTQQKRLPLNREQVMKLERYFEDPKQFLESLPAKATTRPPATLRYLSEFRCLFRLCLYAGMRLSDAVNLKWDSVDFGSHCIRYTPEKTALTSGVEAQVPILPPLLESLPFTHEQSDYVLPEISAHYARNPDYIKGKFIEAIHGITGKGKQDQKTQHLVSRSLYGAHSLRHTFVTEAAKAGVSPAFLSLMSGDNMQTLEKFYVKIVFKQALLPHFDLLPGLIQAPTISREPERVKLAELAKTASLEDVRAALQAIGELEQNTIESDTITVEASKVEE